MNAISAPAYGMKLSAPETTPISSAYGTCVAKSMIVSIVPRIEPSIELSADEAADDLVELRDEHFGFGLRARPQHAEKAALDVLGVEQHVRREDRDDDDGREHRDRREDDVERLLRGAERVRLEERADLRRDRREILALVGRQHVEEAVVRVLEDRGVVRDDRGQALDGFLDVGDQRRDQQLQDRRRDDRDRDVHQQDRKQQRKPFVQPPHQRVDKVREEQRHDEQQRRRLDVAEKLQHADQQIDPDRDQRQRLQPERDPPLEARHRARRAVARSRAVWRRSRPLSSPYRRGRPAPLVVVARRCPPHRVRRSSRWCSPRWAGRRAARRTRRRPACCASGWSPMSEGSAITRSTTPPTPASCARNASSASRRRSSNPAPPPTIRST